MRNISRLLSLLRRARKRLWPVLNGPYAVRRQESSVPLSERFPHVLAAYACRIINPPSQRHMFDNKIHNLNLGVIRMHGLVMGPGEIFSFWRCVGAPTGENGFREGATFINRQVRSAMGGGLCQMSGVIYNAALLSGLKILERHNHSIDAYGEDRYIPLGRDATVAHPRKDLCFQNPFSFDIALALEVRPDQASASILGAQASGWDIRIDVSPTVTIPSPRVEQKDPALPIGRTEQEKGLDGREVTAWRQFILPGGKTRRERLSRDAYQATPTIVRVGSGR